jgi:site-specific DNA-methyltransferase (adenine-specific)
VAANAENAKLPRFWDRDRDGIAQSWCNERVWCNPPYGVETSKWVAKAAQCEADLSVLLVPSKTETEWFHEYAMRASEVRFVRRRVHFDRPGVGLAYKNVRPQFASIILVFGREPNLLPEIGCSLDAL